MPWAEEWKYTNPPALIKQVSSNATIGLDYSAQSVEFRKPPLPTSLVSALERDVPTSETLTHLNGMLAQQVLYGKVNPRSHGTLKLSTSPNTVARVFLDVGELGNLELNLELQGGNLVLLVQLGRGANLSQSVLQPEHADAEYCAIHLKTGASAIAEHEQSSRGGGLRCLHISAICEGENSQANLSGASQVRNQEHLQQFVSVRHKANDCSSEQKFRTVVHDQGQSVFNGKIHIEQSGFGSDARMENKNLLMSPTAEVYSKPELEIYNDDVVCSHGVTTGQLDEEALFYLRSRGLEIAQARDLLIDGFLGELASNDAGRQVLGIQRPSV